MSKDQVKEAASGRWLEILTAAGIPRESLDGKNGRCPLCSPPNESKHDRFAAFPDVSETGGVNCRKCFQRGSDGFATLRWFRGCTFSEAIEFVSEHLGANSAAPSRNGRSKIVATYDYCDELSNLISQVVRFKPKDFRQRRPDGKGGWDWSVKGVRVIPYRLPELSANPETEVFVCEGEKDVDNLAATGALATCNSGGAGKWTAEHSAFLRGRRVTVLPHNDEAGRNHAQQVAQSLQGIAESVRIVELLGLAEKGDVSDWIAAGGTKEELERLAEAADEWTQGQEDTDEPDEAVGPVVVCFADIEPREVSWLWPGRIPLGRISLLVGRPGEGKSFLTVDAAARVSTGTPWPDKSECLKGDVLLISAEDDPHDTIRPRLDAHYADVARVHLLSAVRFSDFNGKPAERAVSLADVRPIRQAVEQLSDCRLIIVDPIGSFLGGQTDAHRDNEVRSVLTPIAKLAEECGAAVLVVAHHRKAAAAVADDMTMGSRAFTGIARTTWHLTRDSGDKNRRLFLPGKNNLGPEGDGLAFSIFGEPAQIGWERDPVAMSADDAIAVECHARRQKSGPAPESLDAAMDWLGEALTEGPRQAKELKDEWCNGQDGSWGTLKRAKKSLEVISFRLENTGPWWWRLPGAQSPRDEELEPLEPLGENTGNMPLFDVDNPQELKFPQLGPLGDSGEL
jgi:hypothetical protein